MKYIITHKSLSSTEYAPERECITVDEFKKMTLDFCHGATIHGKTCKHPTPAWRYDFVDTMPQIYIRMGMTTTEQAYDFGQKLIEACYKANRVKYEALQQAYKDVFRILQKHQCWFPKNAQLPNPTTRTECYYEDVAAKDVRNLNFYQTSAEMSDEELRFYCRAFNINAPEWFITFENHPVKYTQTFTENGATKEVQKKMYAICPTVSGSGKAKYNSDYAGSLDENGENGDVAPYSLLRDAKPLKLSTSDRAMLIDSVKFFLSLSIEEQKNFLSDNFEYTEDGELVEISPEEREERELEMVREAMRLNTIRACAGICG